MVFLPKAPKLSVRVYNGLNYPFAPLQDQEARTFLLQQGWNVPETGFLLHVVAISGTKIAWVFCIFIVPTAKPLINRYRFV